MDDAEVLFNPHEAARFERDLTRVDAHLRSLAHDFKCAYDTNAGRGWPGRRLRRRVRLKTYELKLVLNPNYLQDQQLHYELREQWMYDFGEIFTRLVSHRLLETMNSEDLSNPDKIKALVSGRLVAVLGARHGN